MDDREVVIVVVSVVEGLLMSQLWRVPSTDAVTAALSCFTLLVHPVLSTMNPAAQLRVVVWISNVIVLCAALNAARVSSQAPAPTARIV